MKIAKIRFRKLTGTMETNGPFWEERLLRPIPRRSKRRRRCASEAKVSVDDQFKFHHLIKWNVLRFHAPAF
jgi:hypothetical protein